MLLYTTMGMGMGMGIRSWEWEYGHGNEREWNRKSYSLISLLHRQTSEPHYLGLELWLVKRNFWWD